MKYLATAILVLLAPSAQAATLAADMKELGIILKKLSSDVTDPAKNPASAKASKQLGALLADCLPQMPSTIAQLPADQQPKAMADYKYLIQREIDLAGELELAFANNNNTSAATILKDMLPPKTEGHKKYK